MALVTGAAQGIGRAIALALAERGAQGIATDLTPPHETAKKIGPTAQAFELDVTNEEDWRSVSVRGQDLGWRGYHCEQRWLFPESLDRRNGPADVAKDCGYEFRLTLFECEIFLARDEKEEMGPLRGRIVKHGRLGHTRNEPLHRHKDGNHWVHERLGE